MQVPGLSNARTMTLGLALLLHKYHLTSVCQTNLCLKLFNDFSSHFFEGPTASSSPTTFVTPIAHMERKSHLPVEENTIGNVILRKFEVNMKDICYIILQKQKKLEVTAL
jgi:hypothetical protein